MSKWIQYLSSQQDNAQRISFDPMSLPGCPYCGSRVEKVTPEGRKYLYPETNCCLARSIWMGNNAMVLLNGGKLEGTDLEDWQATSKEVMGHIQRTLALSPAPAALLEEVAGKFGEGARNNFLLRRLQSRYDR